MDQLTPAAEQPNLAGFDAPPATAVQASAQATALPRFAVMGTLSRPPHVHTTTDGAVIVDCVIAQQLEHHPRATPVLASVRFDAGSFALNHDDALHMASRIARDEEVVALGRGLEPGRHHGTDVLRLIHCDRVNPTRSPTPGD